MIEKFQKGNVLYALILRSNYTGTGINFFTQDSESLQLAYMRREKGYEIEPHLHQECKREVYDTQEVLFLKKGKVRIDFYDDNFDYLSSKILFEGDFIILMRGGHGFSMIEESEIIEVKQGPYIEAKDKIRFKKTTKNNIIIE